MDVHISANAFWALLISAIEVYKKECYGILLGYRDSSNSYVVEHAISYQTAQRRHGSVERNNRASRRIHKFLDNLPHLSVIGDFHSHTAWGNLKSVGNLSTEDLSDMMPDHLNFIIVANDNRRSSRLEIQRRRHAFRHRRRLSLSDRSVSSGRKLHAPNAPICSALMPSASMPRKYRKKFSCERRYRVHGG